MSPRPLTTIDGLKKDPRNPRKHGERNLQQIEQSLKNFGAGRSIVIDENNQILAGNGLVEAAGNIGLSKLVVVDATGQEIVAVRRSGLTEKQKTEYRIADNRSADLAEWDPEVLAAMAEEIDLKQFWTDEELEALLTQEPEESDLDAEPQTDRAAELQEHWKVERGQVWQLGNHRLMCGDCTDKLDVAELMSGSVADAVLTDPPYGIDQPGVPHDSPEELQALIAGAVHTLPCVNAVVVAFQSTRTFPVWLDAIRAKGKFERMLWLYKAAQCTFPWRGWILTSESILVASIGDPEWQEVKPFSHDCYYLSEVSGELDASLGWHGSVKPLNVVVDLMQRISAKTSIVFDGFLGSGSTIIAAEQLNRRCFAMEIEPKYVSVCLQRFQDATGKQPTITK